MGLTEAQQWPSQFVKSRFDSTNLGFEMGWWRKKKPESDIVSERGAMLLEDLIECCDGKSNPIKFFSGNEILKATDNLSESSHVTELSDFGHKWYSGKNENHDVILIKIALHRFNDYREGKFCRDIAVSTMVSGHKNFLKLVGCCLEFKYPVMVYHGVKKHYKLDDISEQPWKRKMKIAEDIATAFAYLHTAFPRPFVYRSFSPKKIILDEDGVARLSDFSCCVSIPQGETFVKVDRIVGRFGYMDHNYKMSGVVSEKTDVFAIGIVMQKLLPKEETEEEEGDISEQELCQMKAFGMLSLRCVGPREEVPTMVEVAKELKKIQRSLHNNSSSPSGETIFDASQDVSSSNQT